MDVIGGQRRDCCVRGLKLGSISQLLIPPALGLPLPLLTFCRHLLTCVDMYTHLVFCFVFVIMKMYMLAINFKIAHYRGPFTRS